MSRKVTQVISHSPSHSNEALLSSSGWPFRMHVGLAQSVGLPVEVVDRLIDRQHAVDRRLVAPGEFGGDHRRAAPVAAENGLAARLHFRGRPVRPARIELAAWASRRPAWRPATPDQLRCDWSRPSSIGSGSRSSPARGIADHLPAQQRADAVEQLAFGQAIMIKLRPVRDQLERRAGLAEAVVDIDDVGHRLEDRLDLRGGLLAGGFVRARRSRPAASPAPAGPAGFRPP